MKKLLFFGKKNRSASNVELNERKLYKQGIELKYEYQLKNLKKYLLTEEIFFIIIDGLDKEAILMINEITPTQNILITLDNANEVKGFIEDKINFKFIKKPYSTDDLIFIVNHYNKNASNTTRGFLCKFLSNILLESQNSELEIYDKLEESLDFIANFLDADSGSIMLLNNYKTKLNVEALIGNSSFINTEIDTNNTLSGWILNAKKSVLINKKTTSLNKNLQKYLHRKDIFSSINVILETNSEILGILNLNSTTSRCFKMQDLVIAEYFAKNLAMLLGYSNLIKNKNLEIFDLKETNKDMEHFVYSAFHDLKTPLFTLQGFLDTFKEKYYATFDTEGVKYLMLISNGATKLGKMLNDIFEFFKFDKLKYSFTKTDMSEAINVALDQMQILIEDEDIEINKTAFENNKIYVLGQMRYLSTVWTNLISNAIKYRTEDMIPLKIEFGVKDDGGDMLTFFIKDNGIGIDESEYEFIFKLFTRNKTKKDVEGTGVGLPIVKKIVDKHGGDIWLNSKPNKGTTFYFTIPKYKNGEENND